MKNTILLFIVGCTFGCIEAPPESDLEATDIELADDTPTDDTPTDDMPNDDPVPLNNTTPIHTAEGLSFGHGEISQFYMSELLSGHGALNGWSEETLLLGYPALEGDVSEVWDYTIGNYSPDVSCNTIVKYEIEDVLMNDGPQRCPAARSSFEGSKWKIEPIDIGTARFVIVAKKVSVDRRENHSTREEACANRTYADRLSYQLTVNVLRPTSVQFELPEQCGADALVSENTPLEIRAKIFAGDYDASEAVNYPGLPAFEVSGLSETEILVGRTITVTPNSAKDIQFVTEFDDELTISSVSDEGVRNFELVPFIGSKLPNPMPDIVRTSTQVYFSVAETSFEDERCTDWVMPILESETPEICTISDEIHGGNLNFRVNGTVNTLQAGECIIHGVADGYTATTTINVAD